GEDPASVMAGLRGEAEVLVLVRAEAIGSQELAYYGQSSTLYSAYLGVRAYNVADKRPLGPGIRDKVDFTTLNAQEKALEVVEPGIGGLVDELGPYRPHGRGWVNSLLPPPRSGGGLGWGYALAPPPTGAARRPHPGLPPQAGEGDQPGPGPSDGAIRRLLVAGSWRLVDGYSACSLAYASTRRLVPADSKLTCTMVWVPEPS